MSKSAEHIDAAIAVILAADFVPDGETATRQVRIATVKSPVFGGIGGQAATFGGRKRFARPDGLKVTVGTQTVNFYRVGKHPSFGVSPIERMGWARTRNVDAIKAIIAGIDGPQTGG